ncbi:MAG: Ig-like domain-containing protein [Burkholderiales bacterium]
MNFTMKMLRHTLVWLFLLGLAACGGGGGSAGSGPFGGTPTVPGGAASAPITAPTIVLELSSSTVTSSSPATVTATVRDASGAAIPNQVVTFETLLKFGVLSASTALTNSSGQAIVTLSPAASTTTGADSLTAKVTVNALAATATTGFQLTSTDVSIAEFTSDIGAGTLTAYGQTTLTVTIAGAATGASVNLNVTSACVSAGKATLSPASTTTTTGTATFLFKDTGGCGSTLTSDTLQVAVTGSAATQTLSLGLTAPTASSIAFVSASPETIYLKGSGFVATSQVTFKVVDVANNALPGQGVSMIATTYTGGLTLDGVSTTVTKTSDSNGLVTVLVNSGTIPTPVRIRATLVSSAVTTSSSNLSVAVGLPTQTAFSLSQKTRNIEGFNIDGTPNTYTLIASDRMGNPVPAGTSINFVSEGGQVVGVGQIALTNGLASTTVGFQSASPRPANGRITVVAYALGEESFADTNGNNVYDAGEDFQDLGDVFISRTFTKTFDEANDQRIPQTLTGAANCVNATSALLVPDRTVPTAASYAGVSRCDGVWGQAFVRRATETVLSTSSAGPLWLSVSGASPQSKLDAGCSLVTLEGDAGAPVSAYAVGAGTLRSVATSGTLSFLLSDANPVRLNPMAAGTTLTVTTTSNLTVAVLAGSPVPDSSSATAAAVSYEFTNGATSGTITLNVRSPSGLTSSFFVAITTSAGTSTCP